MTKKKVKGFVLLFTLLTLVVSMVFTAVGFAPDEEPNEGFDTWSYTLEEYDEVSNLDFNESAFKPDNTPKITKGKDRYGVYWDIASTLNAQWALGIIQFPLPIDVTNSSFTYEILSPQTTYWVLVGVASRKVDQSSDRAGHFSLSQEKDLESNEESNRGVLGMYMYTANLAWQKDKYYTGKNETVLDDCVFEENKSETVTLSEDAGKVKVNVSGTDVASDMTVAEYENKKGYIHFEFCSSAAGQAAKIRLRLNKTDLGEEFKPIDLTEYNSADVTAEDLLNATQKSYADYKIFKGSDDIGDYFDVSLKFKNAWCTTAIQFPIPVRLVDPEKGNLRFSYRFLKTDIPYWFGVGVTTEDIVSFVDFAKEGGTPSAFGLYFPDVNSNYQLKWSQTTSFFDSTKPDEDKIDTAIPVTTGRYVHLEMKNNAIFLNGEDLGVDYSGVFGERAYITFMACSQAEGETATFRFRVGTDVETNYSGEAADTTFEIPATGIEITNGTKIINEGDVITMKEGEDLQLGAKILPENSTDVAVVWSCDNASLLTVRQSGKLIAKKTGEVTVTAKAGNFTLNFKVKITVDNPPKKGCGSAILGGFLASLLTVTALGGLFVSRKKK